MSGQASLFGVDPAQQHFPLLVLFLERAGQLDQFAVQIECRRADLEREGGQVITQGLLKEFDLCKIVIALAR